MLRAIERIKHLDISVVCPGHGPILRSNWKKYVEISEKYAEDALKVQEKFRVYIPYVSAYHKTGIIAEKIAEGIRQAGEIEVDVQDIERTPVGEVDERLARCSAIIVGSPTINQNILLPVYKLFATINPLRDKGKLAGAFGSYGWSGENRKMLESNLTNLKLNYFGEGLFVKFTPSGEEIQKCTEYGRAFGKALLNQEIQEN
jgi:flavorubredoxin